MSHPEPVAAQTLQGSDGPLAASFDLVLLDLDGVLYVGPDPVPGAPQAVAALRDGAAGRPVATTFLTNNASRTPQAVADKLADHGVPADLTEVVTSAQVAATILADRFERGARVQVVGGTGLWQAVREGGLEPVPDLDADPVAVVQGFNPDISWHDLAAGARAVSAGLFWVATNLDLSIPTAHGPAPGNGTLVRAVAIVTGREPDAVAGKPRPEPYHEAARRAGSRQTIMVGDRLDTDIEGARAADMAALAVLSGVLGATWLLAAPPHQRPTHLGRDVSALLETHPAVETARQGIGVRARCRQAQVHADAAALAVVEPGDDPLDLLRAACAAQWAWADDHPEGPPGMTGPRGASGAADDPGRAGDRYADVLARLAADGSARGWAR